MKLVWLLVGEEELVLLAAPCENLKGLQLLRTISGCFLPMMVMPKVHRQSHS